MNFTHFYLLTTTTTTTKIPKEVILDKEKWCSQGNLAVSEIFFIAITQKSLLAYNE